MVWIGRAVHAYIILRHVAKPRTRVQQKNSKEKKSAYAPLPMRLLFLSPSHAVIKQHSVQAHQKEDSGSYHRQGAARGHRKAYRAAGDKTEQGQTAATTLRGTGTSYRRKRLSGNKLIALITHHGFNQYWPSWTKSP